MDFPRDLPRRKLWLAYCRRADVKLKDIRKHSTLCSLHFSKKNYERDPKFRAQYGYTKAKPKLFKHAAPDIPLAIDGTSKNITKSATFTERVVFQKQRLLEQIEDLKEAYDSFKATQDCGQSGGTDIQQDMSTFQPVQTCVESGSGKHHFECQSNEVKSSCNMELAGLKKAISLLEGQGCHIAELVTDRHVQVQKFMREEQSHITHLYDVWHVAKGVQKKLESASKKKDCDVIRPWIKTISNHMYWVAAGGGEAQYMLEKWLSVTNHVSNIHSHQGKLYTECPHGPIDQERDWIRPGSQVNMGPTHEYVEFLLNAIVERRNKFPSYKMAGSDYERLTADCPGFLTQSFVRTSKQELVNSLTSRYKLKS